MNFNDQQLKQIAYHLGGGKMMSILDYSQQQGPRFTVMLRTSCRRINEEQKIRREEFIGNGG